MHIASNFPLTCFCPEFPCTTKEELEGKRSVSTSYLRFKITEVGRKSGGSWLVQKWYWINFKCKGAGSRQYCRYTKSPGFLPLLKEIWWLHRGQIFFGPWGLPINRTIRTSLSEGKWSWKRMNRNVTHKFTRANVDYCQDFLNYMSNVDPFRLKFFDESDVSLYDCDKRYWHSPFMINSACVELRDI